jgi:hypothetical protein
MPIEIKEISIKADIYPGNRQPGAASALSQAVDIAKLKREITEEVTQAILQELSGTTER